MKAVFLKTWHCGEYRSKEAEYVKVCELAFATR